MGYAAVAACITEARGLVSLCHLRINDNMYRDSDTYSNLPCLEWLLGIPALEQLAQFRRRLRIVACHTLSG